MKPLQANDMPQFGSSMQKKVMNNKQQFWDNNKVQLLRNNLNLLFLLFVFGIGMFAGYDISLLDKSFDCP